ncbi:hypothetical protein NliqN6_6615 [Naganishia liquefaciens]|uniref:WD40 repeat domain-containing protein n=1 Tax=Naganishia liquefaciens TaxID=104408 RepID=A0A8H3U0I3_9TREE|nr:hypothetical protein NliqN6_6615 [Naganishia liquefaciens]
MNGKSASTSGIGSGASLSARIRRADLPGEWMYPDDAVRAGISVEEVDAKGKGKAKDGDLDLEDGQSEVSKKSTEGHVMPVKREEFVRLMLQALREVGYSQTAEVLRAESGYEEENQLATALRNAILGGRWSESITLLESLGVVQPEDRLPLRRKNSFTSYGRRSGDNSDVTTPGSTPITIAGSKEDTIPGSGLAISPSSGFGRGGLTPSGSLDTGLAASSNSIDELGPDTDRQGEPSAEDSIGRQAIFKIYEQKYFELLELEQQNRALSVLRHQLAPIAAESEKLHALSRCLFKGKIALYEERGWDGARGESRLRLLYQLQELMPSGIIVPPKRLATLFDQARKYQQLECSYHNNEPAMTLLSNHSCKRGSFPTVTTHVLTEHTDEVWVLEWSHDGRFLATGGRDGQVVIWEVGPTPVRKCEKIASLSGHKDPISSIAYSPDDSRLVVTCENTFYLWDTKSGSLLLEQNAVHKDMIAAVKWLPDHQGFVTSSHDMTLVYWTWSGTLRSTINTSPLRIESLLICPSRNRLIAAGFISQPGHTSNHPLPAASRTPDQKPPAINGHEPPNLKTDSDLELMQRTLILYDLNCPGVEKGRRLISGEVTCMSLSPDEEQILLSLTNSELQLWQFRDDTLHFVRKYTGHVQRDGVLLHSCFAGNSRGYVMSASEDAHVYVWHKDTGGLLEVLEGHGAAVTDVAWNPVFSNLFASCSDDYTIRLWQPPADDLGGAVKWGEVRTGTVSNNSSTAIAPAGIDVDMIIA